MNVIERMPGARDRLARRVMAERHALERDRYRPVLLAIDGVCSPRGRAVVRILERESGVKHSLDGAHDMLARLGYTCQSPPPRHEKRNPEDAGEVQAVRPPFFRTLKRLGRPRGKKIRLFFMDEARFDQQGALTKTWAPKGSRPTTAKHTTARRTSRQPRKATKKKDPASPWPAGSSAESG